MKNGSKNEKHEFSNFNSFIEFYKEDASSIDLKEHYRAYALFNQRKLMIDNAGFESETKQANEVIESAILSIKKRLQNYFLNINRWQDPKMIPKFLYNLKLYYEYVSLIKNDKKNEAKPELSLRQVALLCIYNGEYITRENGNGIAKKHGHNTGERLYQFYNKYASSTGRKSSESKRKDSLLLKDIEKVINYLPIEKQDKPKEEAELLRNIVQNKDYTSL